MAFMTAAMRDLLIAHIDGPIQVRIRCQPTLWKAAFAKGLICSVVNTEQKRPRHSRLTQEGRRVLARELASWADVLVLAGYDVKASPKFSRNPPDQLAA